MSNFEIEQLQRDINQKDQIIHKLGQQVSNLAVVLAEQEVQYDALNQNAGLALQFKDQQIQELNEKISLLEKELETQSKKISEQERVARNTQNIASQPSVKPEKPFVELAEPSHVEE